MKKIINAIYFSPYINSEVFLLNLGNSKIYILSHTLKDDLDQLVDGCEMDIIDAELLNFLIEEDLICAIQK